mgnify:CR=1 FL=1
MMTYATTIEPIHHDDPRWSDRSKHNRIAHDALKAAGIKPVKECGDPARLEGHRDRMNAVLEPLGRKAIINRIGYLS